MIGIYVHIPFCRTRCPYCDFVSNAIAGSIPAAFVEALCKEIGSFPGPDTAFSLFLGGGTPSLLASGDLKTIFDAIHRRFRLLTPEITLEANSDDVTTDLVSAWRDLGVNRVSLGVQSFDDRVLRYLGRRHDAAIARRACEVVAEHFDNWGMDLIFGAHPAETWTDTLKACIGLCPKHVSAYGLTYESGTPFGPRAREAIDDEMWLTLYHEAEKVLAGFSHYEVSNYALPGFECRHNLIYWQNEEYAGFGPAAYSFLNNVRARNQVSLADYMRDPDRKQESVALSEREVCVETVIQHLRLKTGLEKAEYRRRFDRDVREDFGPQLDILLTRGLIAETENALRPTPQGFEMNNEIGLALVD